MGLLVPTWALRPQAIVPVLKPRMNRYSLCTPSKSQAEIGSPLALPGRVSDVIVAMRGLLGRRYENIPRRTIPGKGWMTGGWDISLGVMNCVNLGDSNENPDYGGGMWLVVRRLLPAVRGASQRPFSFGTGFGALELCRHMDPEIPRGGGTELR